MFSIMVTEDIQHSTEMYGSSITNSAGIYVLERYREGETLGV